MEPAVEPEMEEMAEAGEMEPGMVEILEMGGTTKARFLKGIIKREREINSKRQFLRVWACSAWPASLALSRIGLKKNTFFFLLQNVIVHN